MNENISTRIDMAIAMLKSAKIIRFQKEIAERMGVDVNTVSRAKRGGDYNPESFAMNFNAAFNFMFSPEWLLHGTGEMLAYKSPPTRIHPSIVPLAAKSAAASSTSKPGLSPSTTPPPTTVPEASAPVPATSIPDWADSLIHLASDNAAAIQYLKEENKHLRELLNELVATNKKLREELTKVLHEVKPSHQGIKYQPSEPIAESIPMAAELKK